MELVTSTIFEARLFYIFVWQIYSVPLDMQSNPMVQEKSIKMFESADFCTKYFEFPVLV